MSHTRADSKPQLFFLGTQMARAGAQKVLLAQADWFHARGYPVKVAFFYDKESLAQTWQASRKFPVLNLNAWRYSDAWWRNIFRLPPALWRLFGLFRSRPQVVQTFTPHSNLLGIPLAWLARVPVRIATQHGRLRAAPGLHSFMINSGMANALVVVSEDLREIAIEKDHVEPNRVTVIQNGVEAIRATEAQAQALRRELGLSAEAQLIICVGRLMETKGQRVLLTAFDQIASLWPQAILAFVGDGEDRTLLLQMIKEHKLTERVQLLGHRDDVPALLSAADIFVQASFSEGLSIALLEALSAGVSVVATRVGGLVQVVEDGESALLISPGDPAALANALERLLADPALRARLATAAQQRVQARYSVDTMCSEYETLMLKLLANGR
jgi:glycosyltransferase involved in cell wall biosynthesis